MPTQPSNIETYVDYFRQLAVTHSALRHNPFAEIGDAKVGESHFCKWNAKEVIGGLRTKVSFPALLIQLYETDLESELEYNVNQSTRGAFAVISEAKDVSFAAEEAAYQQAEIILYQILQQIWNDHYGQGTKLCNRPFENFYFNKLTIQPTFKLFEKHYGYNVDFEFTFRNEMKITQAPDDGVFDNIQILGDDTGWLGFNGQFLGN